MATPVDRCHAQYLACMGSNPTPLQQTQCTFRYAQCILGTAQAMLAKQLKTLRKKPKPKRK
jgi:hypothetical protein